MKKYISYLLLSAIVFASCKKNDGFVPKDVNLAAVPLPLLVKDGGSQAIDLTNLASFAGKIKVSLYYPNSDKPSKFDIVIRKNGDNANVKVLQAGVTTFPSNIDFDVTKIETVFGAPIALGDNYDIGVDVYTASEKFEAFPAVGAAYGSGIANQPGASTSVRYSAICAYDPALYQGDFEVITDDWADYVPGDVVTLTRVDDTHISFEHIAAVNPIPLIITVNPLDNSVTVAKQTVGTRWAYGPQYTGPFMLTDGGGAQNFVAPCDQTITMNLVYGYSAGTFGGTYPLVLKKL